MITFAHAEPKTFKKSHCLAPLLILFLLPACVPNGASPRRLSERKPPPSTNNNSNGQRIDGGTLISGNEDSSTPPNRADASTTTPADAGGQSNPPPADGGTTPPPPNASVTSIRINPTQLDLEVNDARNLQVTADYDDGSSHIVNQDLRWESSNPSVATVSTNGRVTALVEGQTQISAFHKGFTASIPVAVQDPAPPQLTGLEISPSNPSLSPSTSLQLSAFALYDNGQRNDVTAMAQWSSSAPNIATVDAQGRLTQILEGQSTITASFSSVQATTTSLGRDCEYPYGVYSVRKGAIMPDLTWTGVHDENGQRLDFSLADFHCDATYSQYTMVAFVIGTGWCPYCPDQMRRVGNQASALLQDGGLVVYAEVQDSSRRAASSAYAQQEVDRIVGNAPGIRVGAAPGEVIANAPLVTSFPNGFVVRKRDMRVIATHGGYSGSIPYSQIAQDPERDWSQGELPPFSTNCSSGSEESYEPNDRPSQASAISAGNFTGGICAEEPDFYQVNVSGRWRLDLSFTHRTGDIDLYVWDNNQNRVQRDSSGNKVGSSSATDDESYSGSGPATIMIHGYRYASAPYTLTLTELP